MKPVTLNLNGVSRTRIVEAVEQTCPEVRQVLARVRELVPETKREIGDYQGAVLYLLARQFNRTGTRIVEFGTAWGYSAGIMAIAAPNAKIITMTPRDVHVAGARGHLRTLPNVEVLQVASTDWLAQNKKLKGIDMFFVDGDHVRVANDLPCYNMLRKGGLMLHHDYSPAESARPCAWVFDALNTFASQMNHPADVLVIDDENVGVAGWYKREGEVWPSIPTQA